MARYRYPPQYFQEEEDTTPGHNFDLITNLDYFHPNLTNFHEVQEALNCRINKSGSFLLRRSFTQRGAFTVSVLHDDSIKHFKIRQKLNQFYLRDQFFYSLDELVKFYSRNDVPNMEEVKGVRLIYPIPRAERSVQLHTLNTQRRLPQVQSDPNISPNKRFIGQSASDTHKSSFSFKGMVLPPRNITINCGKNKREEQTAKQQRPPIPIPQEAQSANRDGIYDGVYYSHIKEENKLPELIKTLSFESPDDLIYCACGIDYELSQLPQGWSVHISRENNRFYGRPFFMDASDVTSWILPEEVELELTSQQHQMIKFLQENYISGNPPPDKYQLNKWKLEGKNYRAEEKERENK